MLDVRGESIQVESDSIPLKSVYKLASDKASVVHNTHKNKLHT